MAEWSKALDSSIFEYFDAWSLLPSYPGFESQFYHILFFFSCLIPIQSACWLDRPRTWLPEQRYAGVHYNLLVLTMTEQRHIVIVGGGIIGSSIAYFLSRAKNCPAVTLLESSKNVAPGASGKAGGFLALDWHGTSTASLAALSYDLHRQLAEENNGAERWGYRQVEVRSSPRGTDTDPQSPPRHLAQAAHQAEGLVDEPERVHHHKPDGRWRLHRAGHSRPPH